MAKFQDFIEKLIEDESDNPFERRIDHSYGRPFIEKRTKATTIGIASGKGGVGKTTLAVGLGQKLASENKRVLLIDLDYNLSNTVIKLGLPINNDFYDFLKAEKDFYDSIYKLGNLHIVGGCSGNLELFERKLAIDRLVIDLVEQYGDYYDYIIMDSPGGISKEIVALNAFCDHRFIVVGPEKASITDSYSFIKLLKISFGINENFLVVNKVIKDSQYHKIGKVFKEMGESFLSTNIEVVGKIAEIPGLDEIYEQSDEEIKKHNFYMALSDIWKNFESITRKKIEFGNRNINSDRERYFY